MEIAERYLVKRQLSATGLTPEQAEIEEDAIRAIIRDYTREAGVRRSRARNWAPSVPSRCHAHRRRRYRARAQRSVDQLHTILGARRFEGEVAMRTSVPGVATGLAWTPTGRRH